MELAGVNMDVVFELIFHKWNGLLTEDKKYHCCCPKELTNKAIVKLHHLNCHKGTNSKEFSVQDLKQDVQLS